MDAQTYLGLPPGERRGVFQALERSAAQHANERPEAACGAEILNRAAGERAQEAFDVYIEFVLGARSAEPLEIHAFAEHLFRGLCELGEGPARAEIERLLTERW